MSCILYKIREIFQKSGSVKTLFLNPMLVETEFSVPGTTVTLTLSQLLPASFFLSHTVDNKANKGVQ